MNSKTIRRGLAMLGIVALTGLTGVVNASQASALPFDGVAPGRHPCAATGVVKSQAIIYGPNRMKLGTVKLVISTQCRTAWSWVGAVQPSRGGFSQQALVRNPSLFNYYSAAIIHRIEDGKTLRCDTPVRGTACNTPMLNDMNRHSYAQGEVRFGGPCLWGKNCRAVS